MNANAMSWWNTRLCAVASFIAADLKLWTFGHLGIQCSIRKLQSKIRLNFVETLTGEGVEWSRNTACVIVTGRLFFRR
eukprot:m.475146 g.475146  ORF g.475146 m.475146 type:complete len:78 (+) comp37768_c0_seq1:601-834(+)